MRTQPRATRVAFRRAVCASVVLHIGAAVALLALLRPDEVAPRGQVIDTRAPHVQMHLIETAVEIEVRPEPPAPASANTNTTQAPQPPTEVPPAPLPASPPLSRGPFASVPPQTLPAELVALLRKSGPNTAPAASGTAPAVTIDTSVKPAVATGAPSGAATGRAMHGAFKPGQTVVYVLDSSGSMGAAGKFLAARAALAATLAQQPATVRFQVVVYDSTARSLLASSGTLAATDENIGAATAKLALVEPRGKSNHLVALRTALDFRPDVVVWLTDADDLTAAAIKPVLKAAGRPVPVRVCLVDARGVQQPRELK